MKNKVLKPPRLDRRGAWLEEIRRVESPNYDPRPAAAIDLLVLHSISLPPGEFGGDHIDRLFRNELDPNAHPFFAGIASLRVSAHLLINRHGEITQYVPFTHRAWHAGVSEFAGRGDCNDYSIGIELEGCDDATFTPEQYVTLTEITALITSHWPAITLDRIVGHCHIAPDRKTDPGPTFDWESWRASLSARLKRR